MPNNNKIIFYAEVGMPVYCSMRYISKRRSSIVKKDTTSITTNAAFADGFYIANGKLYDANGSPFIMRGVNHAHTWFKTELDTVLTALAKKGVNTPLRHFDKPISATLDTGGKTFCSGFVCTRDCLSDLLSQFSKLVWHQQKYSVNSVPLEGRGQVPCGPVPGGQ